MYRLFNRKYGTHQQTIRTMKEHLKNKVFEQWLIVRKELKENPKQSLKKLVAKHGLSQFLTNVLTELGLIEHNGQTKTASEWKIVNDITDRMKFNIHYAKIKNTKIFYVFDQENNLVDSDYNLTNIARRYNTSYKRIYSALRTMKEVNDFYFSENKDFKVPARKQITKKKSTAKKNKIPTDKIKKVIPKHKISIGGYEEKKIFKTQAEQNLVYAKNLNRKARYMSNKEAVQNSLKREFGKNKK